MTPSHDTPPRGVQLIDRSQWRAIAAVTVLAALALCVALAALLRRPAPMPSQSSPIVHVAPPPACPPCPACAACPACPQPVARRR